MIENLATEVVDIVKDAHARHAGPNEEGGKDHLINVVVHVLPALPPIETMAFLKITSNIPKMEIGNAELMKIHLQTLQMSAPLGPMIQQGTSLSSI